MDECFAAVFGDEGERATAYGQTFYDSLHFGHIMHAPNKDSNAIMVQLGASVPQATLPASTSMPNQDTSHSRAAKREKDKAYRERLKKRKREMEDKMEALTQENKALEDENRALKAENISLNQALQSQGEQMDKHKHELNEVKHELKESRLEVKKQNGLLQTVSVILASSDPSPRDEEVQKLKNEIDLLRQGMGMDSPCLKLMKENAKLKHELEKVKQEKKALKVQRDAVCEKIIAENSSP